MIRLAFETKRALRAAGGSSIALLTFGLAASGQAAPVAAGGIAAPAATTGPSALAAPADPGPAPGQIMTGPQLSVTPLRFEFDRNATGQTMRLINTGAQPLVVQARLFAWSQTLDGDSFAPSRAITISPAIATVGPGQTQIVRLLRNDPASAGEKPFRLTIDQLPDPRNDGKSAANTRIRFVLPLFVDRDQAAPAQLGWKTTADGIEVTNSGGQTARLVNIRVTAGGAPVALSEGGLRYVQGGRAIRLAIAGACNRGPLRLVADADGQALDVQPAPCG